MSLKDDAKTLDAKIVALQAIARDTEKYLVERREFHQRVFDDYVIQKRNEFSDYAKTTQTTYIRQFDDYAVTKRKDLDNAVPELRNRIQQLSDRVDKADGTLGYLSERVSKAEGTLGPLAGGDKSSVRYGDLVRLRNQKFAEFCIDLSEQVPHFLQPFGCWGVDNQGWFVQRR